MSKTMVQNHLSLMPGELIEVRSPAEIAATLDENACLDLLPFMPEMLEYCGKRFHVYKRADKTCDTVNQTGGRRLYNTVHLENLRCDGSEHGGCQASCLLFWKELWLKRSPFTQNQFSAEHASNDESIQNACTDSQVDGTIIYRCQATALPEYTTLLHWWDIRQYVRDLKTGNTSFRNFVGIFCFAAFRALIRLGIGTRALLHAYDLLQKRRDGQSYPVITGSQAKTPTEQLNLQPGELVRIKPLEEINRTLDRNSKNRGMSFDPEMAKFCSGTYRVAKRIDKIIEEHSGRMLHFGTSCVILEDVFCHSEFSSCRLFCPRSIYSYWREIWLVRLDSPCDDPHSDAPFERK